MVRDKVGPSFRESDIPIILEIRRDIPNATMADIGILFGVSKLAISGVLRGDNWNWLTGIKSSKENAVYGTGAKRPSQRHYVALSN